MNNRQKLETQIEKHLHQFILECREHAVDYTVLTARKKHPHLDRGQMATVLELVKVGTDDGFLQGIDRFIAKLDTALAECTEEENPTQPLGK